MNADESQKKFFKITYAEKSHMEYGAKGGLMGSLAAKLPQDGWTFNDYRNQIINVTRNENKVSCDTYTKGVEYLSLYDGEVRGLLYRL